MDPRKIILDRELNRALCRIAAGDGGGLTAIYEKFGRRIYLMALSVTCDPGTAEDVMQDTLVRLWEKPGSYHPGTNPEAYILTVTRNLALNSVARRKYESSVEESAFSELADETGPEFAALEALSLLDDEERQIVTLKIDGGMRHKEIAGILGISTAACEKRYRRALEKMKPYYS